MFPYIVTGLPVEREIPTALVDSSLTEHFDAIIDNVKVILERTPPELAADIYRHGIYLTGGASPPFLFIIGLIYPFLQSHRMLRIYSYHL